MQLVSVVTGILAARLLGPTDFGLATVAIAAVMTGALLLDVTLEEAVVFEGFKLTAAGQADKVKSLLKTALILDTGFGLLVAALLLIVAYFGAGEILPDNADATLLYVAIAGTLAGTIDGTSAAVLLLLGLPQRRAVAGLLSSIVRLVLVIGALSITRSAFVLVLAYTAASLFGAIVLAVASWRAGAVFRRHEGRGTFDRSIAVRLLRFGAYSTLTTSLAAVGTTAFPVLLARWTSAETAGLYRVALLPFTAAALASAPVRTMLLPKQARLFATAQTKDLGAGILRYSLVTSVVGLLGAVVGYFALPTLIAALYGSSYIEAVGAARIMLLAGFLHLLTAWTKSFAGAVGKPRIRTVVLAIEVATTFSVLVALGGDSLNDAAIAVVAGMLASTAAWALLTPRLLRGHSPVESIGATHHGDVGA